MRNSIGLNLLANLHFVDIVLATNPLQVALGVPSRIRIHGLMSL